MKAQRLLSLATIALGTLGIGGAASITNLDLSMGGTAAGGSGYGNSITWTNVQGSGITITATAWSTTGTSSTFQTARLGQYSGNGLGDCNRNSDEGLTGCTNPDHQVDNYNDNDFILFTFSAPVSNLVITADPYGNLDSDVTYFTRTGVSAYVVNGQTLAQIVASQGFVMGGKDEAGTGNTNTVGVTGTGITAILFGAKVGDTNDYFKVHQLSATTTSQDTVTPEPATFGLLGASLLGLGLIRRRGQKS